MKADRQGVVRCAGAPRDLGLDQGSALRARSRDAAEDAAAGPSETTPGALVRDAVARWLQTRVPLRAREARERGRIVLAARARTSRDLARHFPQLSERLEGISRGAGVPPALLIDAVGWPVRERDEAPGALAIGAAVSNGSRAIALLFARPLGAILRESRPDNGFASIELVTPFGVAALIGTNETGLAAAFVPDASDAAPGRELVLAPAALFVQDCLLRFDAVSPARGWCLDRPAGGRFVVALADGSGAAACVRVDGVARTAIELPATGLVLGGAAPSAIPELLGDPGADGGERWLRAAIAVSGLEATSENGVLGVVADAARHRLVILHREAGALRCRTLEISAKG